MPQSAPANIAFGIRGLMTSIRAFPGRGTNAPLRGTARGAQWARHKAGDEKGGKQRVQTHPTS